MLEDHKRTGAYYNAVMQNRRQFQGKVVLDVGTGSGILAIFAAMAGAKKVYAVEATDMAKSARKLVEANKVFFLLLLLLVCFFRGVFLCVLLCVSVFVARVVLIITQQNQNQNQNKQLSHAVEVIQGTVETVELPEKVDIIISEWMGYFLLRESMLDSVLLARDRFLAPGGAMYPSHARMCLAPVRSHASAARAGEFQQSMEGWAEFVNEMKGYYNVDLAALSEDYRAEQRQYYLTTRCVVVVVVGWCCCWWWVLCWSLGVGACTLCVFAS